MPAHLVMACFIILTLGGGLLIGFLFRPGDWYARLAKPWFTPPAGVFAPVWTLLYLMIAIAGWRIFSRDASGVAMIAWSVALALNFVWSPVFFGLHRTGAALAIIVALLAAILVFIASSWPRDAVSALLFAPYAVWVAFAALLNAAIYRSNAGD